MRTCGECSMCCKLMAIVALDKPVDQWCPHAEPGRGCKIYEDRPEECKTFECGWLHGIVDESKRPDKCKVVVAPLNHMVHFVEDIAGHARKHFFDMMEMMARKGQPFVIIHRKDRTLIGNPRVIADKINAAQNKGEGE